MPGLTARMREQTVEAIKQADLVVFLIDARAGIVAGDEIFAELVRSSGKPVIVAANKVRGTRGRGRHVRSLLPWARRAAADLGRA